MLLQIWAGSKQKELRASSMQLLQQYCPAAAAMLAGLVLTAEPLGLRADDRDADTLLGWVAAHRLLSSGLPTDVRVRHIICVSSICPCQMRTTLLQFR